MAPIYLHGLLGPGDRKSLEPMAERVAPGEAQQLHHFLATSPWPTAPLEEELVQHSVGVARQYGGQLGKTANCQVLVSLTLARRELPVCLARRLFLPRCGELGR